MRILLAVNEPVHRDQIARVLFKAGRIVDIVRNAEEAVSLGSYRTYNIVILDLAFPEQDYMSILEKCRSTEAKSQVLVLVPPESRSALTDVIVARAERHLLKPFRMHELSTCIQTMLKDRCRFSGSLFQMGAVTFDSRQKQAMLHGIPVELTETEADVLSYLIDNAGKVVSRSELWAHVLSLGYVLELRTTAAYISRLRKKLGFHLILTIQGRGYTINANDPTR